MPDTILTIGHSTHSIGVFLDLLERNGVTAICDVRSAPYSRINPQFNCEAFQDALKKKGMAYFFLGKELGARSNDPACYVDHRVQYNLLAKTPLFRQGIEKAMELAVHYRLALLCAEKDPLSCHRTILVARALVENGAKVDHILADGSIETHDQAMIRLFKQLHLPEIDMFRTRDELIEEVYRQQGEAIAYEEKTGT